MTATRRGFARRTKTPRRRCIRAAARRPDGSVTRGGPQTLLLRAVPAGATPADGRPAGAQLLGRPLQRDGGTRGGQQHLALPNPALAGLAGRGRRGGWGGDGGQSLSTCVVDDVVTEKTKRTFACSGLLEGDTHCDLRGGPSPAGSVLESCSTGPHAARRATAGLRPRPARPPGAAGSRPGLFSASHLRSSSRL